MIDPNKKDPLPISPSDVCYRAFELMGAKQYADAEKFLASNMARSDEDTAIALYHSTMGVLFKIQGEYKTAWKHYQRAEKLLPNDPALKIISARLLIDQFAEYNQAIKKAKKVLELIPKNPVFAHQAHTTMGLAHVRKSEKKRAVLELKASWGDNFSGFVSAKNIDYELLEALMRKGWGMEECRMFLVKAVAFAEFTREEQFVNLLNRMLAAFEDEYPEIGAAANSTSEKEGSEERTT